MIGYNRGEQGGYSQNTPPPVKNFWEIPPCPAKPDPHRRAIRGEKFLGFFREFSGKFRVFRKFWGIFV